MANDYSRTNCIKLFFLEPDNPMVDEDEGFGWYLRIENPDDPNDPVLPLRKVSVAQSEEIATVVGEIIRDMRPIKSVKNQNSHAKKLINFQKDFFSQKIEELRRHLGRWTSWEKGFF